MRGWERSPAGSALTPHLCRHPRSEHGPARAAAQVADRPRQPEACSGVLKVVASASAGRELSECCCRHSRHTAYGVRAARALEGSPKRASEAVGGCERGRIERAAALVDDDVEALMPREHRLEPAKRFGVVRRDQRDRRRCSANGHAGHAAAAAHHAVRQLRSAAARHANTARQLINFKTRTVAGTGTLR